MTAYFAAPNRTNTDFLYDLHAHIVQTLSPNSGPGWRGEVYAGNRHLATYNGAAVIVHADWLGTTRSTDYVSSGSQTPVVEDFTGLPFGDWIEPGISQNFSATLNFTGKMHDWESNLDYFGPRYDSSSMGRFMSPDPLGGQKIDPQTLNKYSYARNNPINFTDPTGLYTCKDDHNQCKSKMDVSFEKSRQQDLKSENPDVVRAAQAYGDPAKDNGVNVGFADLSSKGENGNTVSTIGTDANGNLRANSDVTINSKASGADFDAAVGHEGSHAADAQDVVRSGLTEDGQAIHAGQNITPYQSEQRAYGVTNAILSQENESRNFSCGMSPCTLGRGVMTATLPGVVDRLLSNSRTYDQGGHPMSSTNQGPSVVNGVTPKASAPH